jgi:hypothetical protein
MDYDELVAKVIALLQREKRVPYCALKRRFALDDDYIEDLKIDLIEAKRLAVDEHDRILVWVGEQASPPPSLSPEPVAVPAPDREREPLSYTPKHLAEKILISRSALEGERKQVTKSAEKPRHACRGGRPIRLLRGTRSQQCDGVFQQCSSVS